ncbi:ubiquitin-conjugating enzyme/RWD-like protein [Pelagophyceae sp. CCMP2097]|nr:ubiquitin-conjugating enzyme/RWD-like protein [Pelagophyceae sp. CCMP2097]
MANPAVRRIQADIRELAANPTSEYHAAPLEDSLFEWHFTVRGPQGTDFQGGVYHGRISLPAEYPFKPPSIMLLTPSGRFETNKKICLSISAHHPEHWQPAWGIRTIIEALVAFFPTPADSAIGALQWRPDERHA